MGGLCWYSDCKKLAIEEIISFKPPADDFQLRMYHMMYFDNLFSMIDIVRDYYGRSIVDDAIKDSLKSFGGYSGKNNYYYMRNIRSACVHRGLDLSVAGLVVGGQVCVLSPEKIQDEFGKGEYFPFADFLRDLFVIYEEKILPVLWHYVEPDLKKEKPISKEDTVRSIIDFIRKESFIPEWVKRRIPDLLTNLPDEALQNQNREKLLKILYNRPDERLKIPA